MKTRTSLSRILDRLLVVEQLAADLYEYYAARFSNIEPVHDLFVRMKNEEVNHKSQVHLQKRIASQGSIGTDMLQVDLSGIDNMISDVRAQISNPDISLREALDYAISLETGSFEAVYRTAIAKHSPELSKLVRLLSSGDEQHVKQLQRCRDSYCS